MRALHKAYGKEIWKRCIFALNLAWDNSKRKNKSKPTEAVTEYKTYIQEWANKIQMEVHKMGLVDAVVKTPFDEQQATNEGALQLMAVPVGVRTDDEILPGIQLDNEGWKDYFFLQMMGKCPKEKVKKLLKYRYQSLSAVEHVLMSMGCILSPSLFGAIYGGIEGSRAAG